MGKRKRPEASASPPLWATPEPFDCWYCRREEHDEAHLPGAGVDLWSCMGIWLCLPCCVTLVEASTPPKRSSIPWERLPKCSRCEAQVPGYVLLPEMDGPQGDNQPVWLCHQCCVTLHRQALQCPVPVGATP